jgi:5-hydroxyisourate hydrolase
VAQNGQGSADPRPTISTHVLDTASGKPAAGVHVTLSRLDGDGRALRMTQALTDGDGRVRDLLERPLAAGVYRLEFRPAAAAEDRDATSARDAGSPGDAGSVRFFERVAVDFRVDDVSRSYHVPLLLAPFAMSTYRGS